MQQIYLDYNATTPVDPRVVEKMLPYFTNHFGNAASATHLYGRFALEAVETARNQVARLVGAEAQEIIFTSGATEAINLALKGAFEYSSLSQKKRIVTVKTEHKAVLDVCAQLEQKGAEIIYLNVDAEGVIDLNEVREAVNEHTLMVAVMMANNETGVIHPVQKISAIAHEKNSLLFCDATQAAGKIHIDVNELGIDLLCLSAHKLYGPKGAGALYVRRKNPRVSITAQIHGGGHERSLRSGTLNVPGIVGLGYACQLAMEESWEDNARISALRGQLEHHLLDMPGLRINGSTRDRLYNTSNLCFSGKKANDLLMQLKNLAFSFGSACTSAEAGASHVLTAMGLTKEDIASSVRFSLGRFTTESEIKTVLETVRKHVYGLNN